VSSHWTGFAGFTHLVDSQISASAKEWHMLYLPGGSIILGGDLGSLVTSSLFSISCVLLVLLTHTCCLPLIASIDRMMLCF